MDKLISGIRGAMRGYSGFFDLVQVDVALLDRVYAHDVKLMDGVESLAEAVERLPADSGQLKTAIDKATAELAALDREWQLRTEILRGME